jgi:predicted amidophosphoribosyltransferase
MDTRQQVSLSGDLRRTNVVGAFESREDMTGRHVVLIDDVMTTGATLQECATVLRAAGAASVRTVTLAHG